MEDSKGIRVKIKENSEISWKISKLNKIEEELYSVLNWEKQCFIDFSWDYISIIKFFGEIQAEDKSKIKQILSNNIDSASNLEVKIQWIKFHTIQEINNEKSKQVEHYLEKLFTKEGKIKDCINFSVGPNEVFLRNRNGIDKDTIVKIYNLVKKLWGHKKVDVTHVNNTEIIEITVLQDMFKYEKKKELDTTFNI